MCIAQNRHPTAEAAFKPGIAVNIDRLEITDPRGMQDFPGLIAQGAVIALN